MKLLLKRRELVLQRIALRTRMQDEHSYGASRIETKINNKRFNQKVYVFFCEPLSLALQLQLNRAQQINSNCRFMFNKAPKRDAKWSINQQEALSDTKLEYKQMALVYVRLYHTFSIEQEQNFFLHNLLKRKRETSFCIMAGSWSRTTFSCSAIKDVGFLSTVKN